MKFMWFVGKPDAIAFSLLSAALAAGVTAHVLLTKRDVGASTAWIGLAWLSPIAGIILYWLFGINRVRTRAISLKQGRRGHRSRAPVSRTVTDNHLSPLELAVGRVTGRQAAEGNSVTLLRSGDEAYPKMIAAIEAARASVALSSYIFRLDRTGTAFVEALTRAHRRGVDVRVIVDGIGSGYMTSPVHAQLSRNGVPVARFLHSPLPWRMPFLNLRTHKKLLSIDGRMAFAGGVNIGDENRVLENPPDPVRDTHFVFEGPVVAQLNEVFVGDWLFVGGQHLDRKDPDGKDLGGDAWFPVIEDAGPAIVRAISSGPDQDVEKIESVIHQAIVCARRSIKIVTPYFLPDERLVTALALAAMRGIAVDIMVPETNNHLFMGWAMKAEIGPLLDAGCRVWSNPPPFDHSKLMTVDGIWGLVGSANWDMRSFRLNFELDLEVYHSDLIGEIEASLAAKQGRPITLADLAARPLPTRLRDSAARLLLPYL